MRKDGFIVRTMLIAAGLLVATAFLSHHLFTIQLERHEELLVKARAKYTASRRSKGVRGTICDVHGNLLAANLACRDVLAEPRQLRRLAPVELEKVVDALCTQLRVPKEVLGRRLNGPLVEIVVKREADLGDVAMLQQWIAQYNAKARSDGKPSLRGIRFVDTRKRFYPKHRLAANVLGFTDTDGHGAAGIEKLMEKRLAPTEGTALYERDRRGRQLSNEDLTLEQPRDGWHVYLTIDEPIQSIVEEELAALCEQHEPKAAYAIMADPKTGAVLAMAQMPTFNPNRRENIRPEQWQNRILTHGFEPGSIMKCVSVAGAIDYQVVNLGTVFYCEEGIWYHVGRPLRDSGHSYEDLRVWEIVQKSSNIGTAKIAVAMGRQKLHDTLRRFGFGEPTGLGFPGEAPGIFRSLPDWDGLSLSRFAIGQGILVTPLQVVQAYCALANDGIMMQMRIIDRLEDPETGLVETSLPQVRRRAVRRTSAKQIVVAMKAVTREGGTATKAAVPGYEVAGKTGTAQKFVGGTYNSGRYVASFAGFVPADDPAFVLIVVADEPSGTSYYGGTVAAPTFSRIAERSLRYLQVAPATALASGVGPGGGSGNGLTDPVAAQ